MELPDLPDLASWGDGGESTRRDWSAEVERLLYEGETVEDEIDVGDGASVVVTSHRVLAFKPRLDGANFEQVDRPNVDGVSLSAMSRPNLASRGLELGLVGVVLLVGGTFVNLDSLVSGADISSGAAGQIGVGGIVGMLQGVLDLLALLDEVMLVGGALFLLAALAFAGGYLYTRHPTLVVEVAGGQDIHLPRPTAGGEFRERLEGALGIRPNPAGSGTASGDGADPWGDS